jgi:hypothetical protein
VAALWKAWTANCAAHSSHSAYCYGCHPYFTTLQIVLQKATPSSLTQSYRPLDVLRRLNVSGATQTHKLGFWVKINVNQFMPYLKKE